MTSTTVAQHTTQPLNFGPEWLRALSTPDSATSIPTSGGSGSGSIFKFSATKYRYSKDEILALRANVSERLTEATRNEILENLKDVESVFRLDIIDPVALTVPTAEETAKMNALSSYISGRTPGGAGRAGNNSQQSQQDPRNNRGGGSMSNGRGGSRGRGGRDNTYGPTRGNNNNNNSDENGESGNTGDETPSSSSSWSSRGNYHSRGGSFGNRVRSYEDREQSQTFRRGGGNGRQTSDGWRRSRGDDDDNNEQNEDSPTAANGSASWTSRGGQTRRGGSSSSSSMEHRTKSNEKWNYNDDRPGPSNSYESNQQRGGGWRTNSSTSDRDFNSRRPPVKRERMPEWMDDDNNDDDDDNHLSNATFEQDGTFTRSAAVRQSNSDEQQKPQTQSVSDESVSQNNSTPPRKEEEEVKPEKSTPQTETAAAQVPAAPEPVVSQPTPPVQQSISSWDNDFDHSDVAKAVVELTLAEDHDYSPPSSANAKSRLISMESSLPTVPTIPQQQQRAPTIIDDKQWFYKDPQNTVQGPFSSADMERWFAAGYFTVGLPVKRLGESQFSTIQQLTKELGRLPFRTDVSSLPPTPVQKQQPIAPESQKFNPMAYATSSSSSTANNTFIDDYLMQQQQQQSRQNVQQHSLLFNRQTSMPLSTNDRKTISSPSNITSRLQTYLNSQQQQQQPQQHQSSSSIFSSNLANDPAIIYQQQLQRSMSSATSQHPNSVSYDDMQRSFRPLSSQSSSAAAAATNSSYFPSNVSIPQQSSNDLMARLAQAMQTREKQQDKLEEQRRREIEFERLQREKEERRKMQEVSNNRQINFEQLTKSMENKNQSSLDFDQMITFQQSLQYQKEQQAKLEAQQAENVRRYQQHYREQPQQSMYKLPETVHWPRHSSQTNDARQLLGFTDIQEQEQERRSREVAAAFAHQYANSEILPIPNSSSPSASSSPSTNKSSSWARTLFAGSNNGTSNIPSTPSHILSDHDTNENPLIDSSSSSIASYNQQATNAPKSRPVTNQPSTPWNGASHISNTSLQDVQRQQTPNEIRQQQSHHITSGHSSASTPMWGGNFHQPPASQQSSAAFLWDNNQQSSLPNKSGNKSSTPWTELKPTSSAATTTTPGRINPTNDDPTKNEREAKRLFAAARTQDALSKWTQAQFKDNLKDIDVPTLVQLLKDIDNAGEIVEYVQPYIGSVSKAKEFAHDFLTKRNQLANAEPDLDNERLNELAMAPTSSNDNSGSGGDEGFQLASSNGQKKKAKKMKGQKIDGKQVGFTINSRVEQRNDNDKVSM